MFQDTATRDLGMCIGEKARDSKAMGTDVDSEGDDLTNEHLSYGKLCAISGCVKERHSASPTRSTIAHNLPLRLMPLSCHNYGEHFRLAVVCVRVLMRRFNTIVEIEKCYDNLSVDCNHTKHSLDGQCRIFMVTAYKQLYVELQQHLPKNKEV